MHVTFKSLVRQGDSGLGGETGNFGIAPQALAGHLQFAPLDYPFGAETNIHRRQQTVFQELPSHCRTPKLSTQQTLGRRLLKTVSSRTDGKQTGERERRDEQQAINDCDHTLPLVTPQHSRRSSHPKQTRYDDCDPVPAGVDWANKMRPEKEHQRRE
jgi:hypothetical protein